MGASSLPCEDEVPERFARSTTLKVWFCDGYQDGRNEAAMQSQEAVRRHQGDHAWDAYCLGYEAGKKQRLAGQM